MTLIQYLITPMPAMAALVTTTMVSLLLLPWAKPVTNDDCEFGDCLNVFGQYGFKGYCSMRSMINLCATNGGSMPFGAVKPRQLGSHCMMKCDNEPAQKTTSVGIFSWQSPQIYARAGQQCDNGTCPEGQYCTITTTGYELPATVQTSQWYNHRGETVTPIWKWNALRDQRRLPQ